MTQFRDPVFGGEKEKLGRGLQHCIVSPISCRRKWEIGSGSGTAASRPNHEAREDPTAGTNPERQSPEMKTLHLYENYVENVNKKGYNKAILKTIL